MKIVLGMFLFLTMAVFSRHVLLSNVGEELNANEAMAISGGGCGYEIISGTKNCSGGGTHLCGGDAVSCSSITFTSLVGRNAGSGDQVSDKTETWTCYVCGSRSCGSTVIIKSTKQCSGSQP
ncbi:MAG: hypothetical protein ACK5YR_11025 [Pirellula sp.]|jgi:hypothetical protein